MEGVVFVGLEFGLCRMRTVLLSRLDIFRVPSYREVSNLSQRAFIRDGCLRMPLKPMQSDCVDIYETEMQPSFLKACRPMLSRALADPKNNPRCWMVEIDPSNSSTSEHSQY